MHDLVRQITYLHTWLPINLHIISISHLYNQLLTLVYWASKQQYFYLIVVKEDNELYVFLATSTMFMSIQNIVEDQYYLVFGLGEYIWLPFYIHFPFFLKFLRGRSCQLYRLKVQKVGEKE